MTVFNIIKYFCYTVTGLFCAYLAVLVFLAAPIFSLVGIGLIVLLLRLELQQRANRE